jgi:hypothetical protein
VTDFNYLGRTLTALNDDTLSVHQAIAKAKSKWAKLRLILGSKPILTKTFVWFYKTIECAAIQERNVTAANQVLGRTGGIPQ